MFAALETYLGHDPQQADYAALARQLQVKPLSLAVALKRLRERFRDLAAEELADTVVSAEDLAMEQAALQSILRQDPPS